MLILVDFKYASNSRKSSRGLNIALLFVKPVKSNIQYTAALNNRTAFWLNTSF